jgi:hypothetical protein
MRECLSDLFRGDPNAAVIDRHGKSPTDAPFQHPLYDYRRLERRGSFLRNFVPGGDDRAVNDEQSRSPPQQIVSGEATVMGTVPRHWGTHGRLQHYVARSLMHTILPKP